MSVFPKWPLKVLQSQNSFQKSYKESIKGQKILKFIPIIAKDFFPVSYLSGVLK